MPPLIVYFRLSLDEVCGAACGATLGVGAAAGLKVKLFLPKTAPPAKMIQSLQYGADLVLAEKNYDQAFALSIQYSKKFGGMNLEFNFDE